ncbi:Uncharacterised protein [Klebsiella variicola]|uniref:Uncharacterized protein n=1 Tax=Klebsiella variicola TaxID=244366 RepID=A0ABD7PDB4_KLEVA|nr:Uncharacterised protein [Klebsiella variicola]
MKNSKALKVYRQFAPQFYQAMMPNISAGDQHPCQVNNITYFQGE